MKTLSLWIGKEVPGVPDARLQNNYQADGPNPVIHDQAPVRKVHVVRDWFAEREEYDVRPWPPK